MTPDERLRGERLRAYVEATQGVPATFDACSTWPAQWASNERGVAFDWPDYDHEAGMRAMIDADGGLAAVWTRVAARAGLTEIAATDPIPLGSIGVARMSHSTEIGCIFADGHVGCFRVRDRDGQGGVRMIGLRRHTILKAWAI